LKKTKKKEREVQASRGREAGGRGRRGGWRSFTLSKKLITRMRSCFVKLNNPVLYDFFSSYLFTLGRIGRKSIAAPTVTASE
jgi:hypothetical protein